MLQCLLDILRWTGIPSKEMVISCWLSCDGLAAHPRGVVLLPFTSCWVSCDGIIPLLRGVVLLLVISCWVSCDGLASYQVESGVNASRFMLGMLRCTGILCSIRRNTPSSLCLDFGKRMWNRKPFLIAATSDCRPSSLFVQPLLVDKWVFRGRKKMNTHKSLNLSLNWVIQQRYLTGDTIQIELNFGNFGVIVHLVP